MRMLRNRAAAAAVTVTAILAGSLAGAPGALADRGHGGDCTLLVPAAPLTAAGLATPYQLSGPGCTMASSADVGAFVQATIVTPDGHLLVYDPLVITAGTVPAAPPVVPALPAGSVTGIWTGYNGNVLTLAGPGSRFFTQGIPGSAFGQVAAANAGAFFAAAASAHVKVPPLGTGLDGRPCPSTRDFSLVDQDPSDNVTTQYLLTAGGRTAQDTRANVMALGGASVIGNGSDNRLLTHFVDPALGCVPFTAPDLADNMAPATSQGLDELQAAAGQQAPVALVPPDDPMTLVKGELSAAKTNAYRASVGQPALTGDPAAYVSYYCAQIRAVAPARLAADAPLETGKPSPAAGQDLAAFLQARYRASLVLLGCP
jgi:hypothetical protein